jgi:predicted DNA-binding transcriptional regulator AlpA
MRDDASSTPTTTSTPWDYTGIPRSSFYRLMAQGEAPMPINLPGRRRWRTADLDRWISKRRQVRQLRPAPEAAIRASVESRRRKRAGEINPS